MSGQMSEDVSSVCNLSSDELSFLMDVCNITAPDDSNCHQILLSEISRSQQLHSDIAGFKVPPDPNVFVNGLNSSQFHFNISDFIFDEHFQSNHHDSNIETGFDDLNCDPFPDNVWKNHESNSCRSDQFHSLTFKDQLELNSDQDNHKIVKSILLTSFESVLSDQEPNSTKILTTFEDSSLMETNLLNNDSLSAVLGLSGCVDHMSNLTGMSHNVPESSPTSQIQPSISSEMPTSLMSSSHGYFYSSGKLIFHVLRQCCSTFFDLRDPLLGF
jgi:hypothetical protein